jgi:hypothetical protein
MSERLWGITIPLCRPRIEPERDGWGWLVLLPSGHGWLCGDRRQALRELRRDRAHRTAVAMTSKQVFVLRIACPPGAAGLHALRALLKRLLRDHGFICLHAQEVIADATGNDKGSLNPEGDPERRRRAPPEVRDGDPERRRRAPPEVRDGDPERDYVSSSVEEKKPL